MNRRNSIDSPIPKNDTERVELLRYQVKLMREIIHELDKMATIFGRRRTPHLPSIVYEMF